MLKKRDLSIEFLLDDSSLSNDAKKTDDITSLQNFNMPVITAE